MDRLDYMLEIARRIDERQTARTVAVIVELSAGGPMLNDTQANEICSRPEDEVLGYPSQADIDAAIQASK